MINERNSIYYTVRRGNLRPRDSVVQFVYRNVSLRTAERTGTICTPMCLTSRLPRVCSVRVGRSVRATSAADIVPDGMTKMV